MFLDSVFFFAVVIVCFLLSSLPNHWLSSLWGTVFWHALQAWLETAETASSSGSHRTGGQGSNALDAKWTIMASSLRKNLNPQEFNGDPEILRPGPLDLWDWSPAFSRKARIWDLSCTWILPLPNILINVHIPLRKLGVGKLSAWSLPGRWQEVI